MAEPEPTAVEIANAAVGVNNKGTRTESTSPAKSFTPVVDGSLPAIPAADDPQKQQQIQIVAVDNTQQQQQVKTTLPLETSTTTASPAVNNRTTLDPLPPVTEGMSAIPTGSITTNVTTEIIAPVVAGHDATVVPAATQVTPAATTTTAEISIPKKKVNSTTIDPRYGPVTTDPRYGPVTTDTATSSEGQLPLASSFNGRLPAVGTPGPQVGLPEGVVVPTGVEASLLHGKLLDVLKSLPVQLINDALVEYDDAVKSKKDQIRNHGAYLYGVIKRYANVQDRALKGEGINAMPMGPDLTPLVKEKLGVLVQNGFCTQDEMNDKVKSKIRMLSEKDALFAIDELASVDRGQIRNFGSYFMGILNRYMRGDSGPGLYASKRFGKNDRSGDRRRGRESDRDHGRRRERERDDSRSYLDRYGRPEDRGYDAYRRERSRDRYDSYGDDRDRRSSDYRRSSSDHHSTSRFADPRLQHPPPPPPPQTAGQPPQQQSPYGSFTVPPPTNAPPPPPPPRGAPQLPPQIPGAPGVFNPQQQQQPYMQQQPQTQVFPQPPPQQQFVPQNLPQLSNQPAPAPAMDLNSILGLADKASQILSQNALRPPIAPPAAPPPVPLQPPNPPNYYGQQPPAPSPARQHTKTIATLEELPMMVKFAVQNLQATGHVDGSLDGGILGMLKDLPEPVALSSIERFSACDTATMRNKHAYLAGILRRELDRLPPR